MTKKVTSNAHTREKKVKPRVVKTEAILEKIFDRVADGESLNKICSEAGMPARKSFFAWVADDSSILRRYEFAMLMRADTFAEETLEIADDSGFDWKYGKDQEVIIDGDAIQRARLRVDARKWYASKLNPKKYGDKVTNEHQGGDPDKPINHNIQISFVSANAPK